MRRIAYLALGFIAIALVSLPVAAQRAPKSRAASVALQKRGAKPAARLGVVREIDLEGLKTLLQRSGKQPRPLLVNFWATWCEPCREEFPDLVQIDRDYKARGLEFILVSIDDPAEIKTGVLPYLKKMRAGMPAYLLNVPDPEPAIKSVDETWGGELPATFLFDAEGQIIFKQMGRVNPAELRSAIEKVMGGK
jgi:thiol-disulfide isomerase/thioredoxin